MKPRQPLEEEGAYLSELFRAIRGFDYRRFRSASCERTFLMRESAETADSDCNSIFTHPYYREEGGQNGEKIIYI